jgi:hypothetical protein
VKNIVMSDDKYKQMRTLPLALILRRTIVQPLANKISNKVTIN